MKEDIRLVEIIRNTVGDDYVLMVAANKAILDYGVVEGTLQEPDRRLSRSIAESDNLGCGGKTPKARRAVRTETHGDLPLHTVQAARVDSRL
jgi:hypothetical protein